MRGGKEGLRGSNSENTSFPFLLQIRAGSNAALLSRATVQVLTVTSHTLPAWQRPPSPAARWHIRLCSTLLIHQAGPGPVLLFPALSFSPF